MVDLGGFADRNPRNLSGGQQQRVATARAIAIEPEVMLMDEPLGALDKKLRDQLEVELTELQDDLGITTLYVTHNQEEALTIADRIAVMNEGRIEQIATPIEVYEEPATEFVADFIGDTNFLEGDLRETDDGQVVLTVEGTDIVVNTQNVPADGGGAVFVRPEKMNARDPDFTDDTLNTLPGRVERRLFLGSKVRYFVDIGDDLVTVDDSNKHATTLYDPGDDIVLSWSVKTRGSHTGDSSVSRQHSESMLGGVNERLSTVLTEYKDTRFGKYALIGPTLLVVAILMIFPTIILLSYSFNPYDQGSIQAGTTIAHYVRAFTEPLYQETLIRTIKIAAIVTVVDFVLGFPSPTRRCGKADGWGSSSSSRRSRR